MSASTGIDQAAAVAAEFLALAEVLDGLDDGDWHTPSLCAGWPVREAAAHLSMPVRYSPGVQRGAPRMRRRLRPPLHRVAFP